MEKCWRVASYLVRSRLLVVIAHRERSPSGEPHLVGYAVAIDRDGDVPEPTQLCGDLVGEQVRWARDVRGHQPPTTGA